MERVSEVRVVRHIGLELRNAGEITIGIKLNIALTGVGKAPDGCESGVRLRGREHAESQDQKRDAQEHGRYGISKFGMQPENMLEEW